VARGAPTNNLRPDQHSPLDRLTSTQGKEEKEYKLNNKQAAEKTKDME
jgi:hypothetical protein